MNITQIQRHREPWNKGKLVGQKAPLKLREIWAIRIRLQLARKLSVSRQLNPMFSRQLKIEKLLTHNFNNEHFFP